MTCWSEPVNRWQLNYNISALSTDSAICLLSTGIRYAETLSPLTTYKGRLQKEERRFKTALRQGGLYDHQERRNISKATECSFLYRYTDALSNMVLEILKHDKI